MPIKKIVDKLYNYTIYIAYRESSAKLIKFSDKKMGNGFNKKNFSEHINDENVPAFVYYFSNNEILVIFKEKKALAVAVVHELFHVTAKIMRDAGLELTAESEEAYAYYLEWIFDEAIRFIRKIEGKA